MKFGANYWKSRTIKNKDYMMTLEWIAHLNPEKVFDFGCGNGKHVHCFRYYGVEAYGVDVSKHAIENPEPLADGYIHEVPLEDPFSTLWATPLGGKPLNFDLVVCIDVLEHISIKNVKDVIKLLYEMSSKYILVSICFPDDPNWDRDETHVTKRPRVWWKEQFESLGLNEKELPKSWMFRPQFMLFEKK